MTQIIAVTLLMLLFFFQSLAAPTPAQTVSGKSDRDYDRLVGPVRSVRTEIERQSKLKGTTRELNRIVVYDESGRLTDTLNFGFDNCVISRTKLEYGNAGSRAERVFWGKGVLEGDAEESSEPKKLSIVFKQNIKVDDTGNRYEVDDYDPTGLRPAAEEAAREWEFRPTYLSKMPVKVIGTITFNFTL